MRKLRNKHGMGITARTKCCTIAWATKTVMATLRCTHLTNDFLGADLSASSWSSRAHAGILQGRAISASLSPFSLLPRARAEADAR